MSQIPFITVLIPALNEQEHIVGCLEAIQAQDYPKDRFEVVVIDNGSVDGTQELVKQAGVRLLAESRKSAYWARNLGIESTEGDFLAFTDADCLADPGWLRELASRAEESGAAVVGGMIQYDLVTDTLGNRLLAESHRAHHVRANIEDHHSVAGGNMFVRRDAFRDQGLFNVIAWGSDIEFSQRVARAGGGVAFAESAIVRHQCDLSNWEYLRRSYETRYGQILLFDERRGPIESLKGLRRIPWKPGFRSGRERYSDDLMEPASVILDWGYRWGNRWMEFFGEQAALLTRKGS